VLELFEYQVKPMRKKTRQYIASFAATFFIINALAASPADLLKSEKRSKNIPTVITSNKLDFDYENLVALFDGNVVVKDQQFTIKSDRMIIFIEKETNEIKRVDASGKVYLTSGEMEATCGKATYTRKNNQVLIQVDPVVKKGDNVITGKKMSIWLDEERVVVEESVALEAMPGK
jgi:lipopolysaccharide export system protein LptA